MLIYVAGPIRPTNGKTVKENCDIAKSVALELWKMGHAVICPHANTDLPIELAEKSCESNVWLDGDLQMLARSDAVVVCQDSAKSVGTQGELEFASKRGIPVYYYPDVPELHPTEKLRPNQCKAFIDIVMRGYRVHLDKNADYSPANILGTGELGLMTRIWDKIARLMNLSGFKIDISGMRYEKPCNPKVESISDSILDLTVYGIIWQIYRTGDWGK